MRLHQHVSLWVEAVRKEGHGAVGWGVDHHCAKLDPILVRDGSRLFSDYCSVHSLFNALNIYIWRVSEPDKIANEICLNSGF